VTIVPFHWHFCLLPVLGWSLAVPGMARAQAPAARGSPEAPIVQAFLARVKGQLGDASRLESFRADARVVIKDVEAEAAASTGELPRRLEIARNARTALLEGLTAELGGPRKAAAAEAFLAKAAREHRESRTDYLERALICWCTKEDWTRTLSGCPETCAEEQKQLLRKWLDEGATDEEIIDRMVAHPSGGPRVRAAPEAEGSTWVGYLSPAIAALAGLAVLAVLLVRMTRQRPAGPAGAPAAATQASGTPSSLKGDDEISEQIERELKEMEGP